MKQTAERAKPSLPAVVTIEQCDQVLHRYASELRKADGDPEQQALARYEIDRWLDLRLSVMRSLAA